MKETAGLAKVPRFLQDINLDSSACLESAH